MPDRISVKLYACATAFWFLLASSALAQNGVWTPKASMPTARCCLGIAAIGDKLYAVGGLAGESGSQQILRTLEAYDKETDTWSTKAPMPTPRLYLAVGEVDGVLYAVGGENSQSGYISSLDAYDPNTNTWSAKAPMPTPRNRLAVAASGGVLYAIGGDGASGLLTTVEAYDPKTDKWSTKAPMPTPRYDLAAVTIGGIIYAVGGNDIKDGTISTVEAYDPKTNTWTTKAAMPTRRDGLGIAAVAGILYAIGGSDAHEYSTVESYDPHTDTWITAPPMPTGRHNLVAGALDDTIYAIGGLGFNCCIGGEPLLGTNEAFSPFEMVSIDVKPGDASNTINLKSNGLVPVAILGSATFDPMTVDPATVTFAGAPVATQGRGAAMSNESDVNHDGYPDLVLFFRTQDMTALQPSPAPDSRLATPDSREVVLYGTTYSGQRIRGSDTVRIVPASSASPRTSPRSGTQTGPSRGTGLLPSRGPRGH